MAPHKRTHTPAEASKSHTFYIQSSKHSRANRLAPWTECKRQFYLHHRRVAANDHPLHFKSFCPVSRCLPPPVVPSLIVVTQVSAEDRKAYQARLSKRRGNTAADSNDTAGQSLSPPALCAQDHLANATHADSRPLVPDGHPVPVLESVKPKSYEDVRIAFTLFVNPNDPIWRLHRIINAIYTENDFFFVHIDASPQYRTQVACRFPANDSPPGPRSCEHHAVSLRGHCRNVGPMLTRLVYFPHRGVGTFRKRGTRTGLPATRQSRRSTRSWLRLWRRATLRCHPTLPHPARACGKLTSCAAMPGRGSV